PQIELVGVGMTNDVALHHENHVLRDIGGEVGDPLQITRGGEQLDGPLDGTRIPLHQALQLAVHAPVDVVDGVVHADHLARHLDVELYQRIECVAHHGADHFGQHVDEVGQAGNRV